MAIGYLTLTTSYSLWWRHIVVTDVLAIAAGFVLRASGGAAATGVPLSRSFVIVTSASAVFVVAGKRYGELGGGALRAPARATLRTYTRRSLGLLLAGAAALACVAYAWWAFVRPDLASWRMASMLPFVLWFARYGWLLDAGAGEAPDELIVGDPALLALSLLWAALFVGGVYASA